MIDEDQIRNDFMQIAGIDQKITQSEFYVLFSKLFPRLVGPQFQQAAFTKFHEIDTDRNGYLDFNEFRKAYHEHFQQSARPGCFR